MSKIRNKFKYSFFLGLDMKNEGMLFLAFLGIAVCIGAFAYITGFVILSPSVPGVIDSCGILDTNGTYILNKSLVNNGTCFTIKSNNTVLDCNNSAITGNKTGNGIEILGRNVSVRNCILANFADGIYIINSSNNTLEKNVVTNSINGLHIVSSPGTLIKSNLFSGSNFSGIYMQGSSNTIILENRLVNNKDSGVYAWKSDRNKVERNNISKNRWGVTLLSSNKSIVYNNYLSNNFNAYDDSFNLWNISKTNITNITNIIGGVWMGGNYWDDYLGKDDDEDGIGDTEIPYDSVGDIENGGDYLPLVPFTIAPEEPVVYTPTAEELEAGYATEINVDESVEFEFNLETHYLTLTSFEDKSGNESINLSISPEDIEFSLKINKSKEIDIDGDGNNDVYAGFSGITENDLPEIIVKMLPQPLPPEEPVTPNVTTTPLQTTPTAYTPPPAYTPPATTQPEEEGGVGTIIIILMVIVLLGVGGFAAWYFLLKKKPAGAVEVTEGAAGQVVGTGGEAGAGGMPAY
jgi:parallel beta-helix repeat protein